MTKQDLQRVESTYRRIGRRWLWNAVSFAGFGGWEASLRRRTVERLDPRPGDRVLDLACGRGSNFAYLRRALGGEGRIVGVDYSATMLAGARDLARGKGWSNVDLVRADAAQLPVRSHFEAALCTNAMLVIPRWQEALEGLVAAVRPGGRVAVLDGRLASGIGRVLNPYARLFSRVVAADPDRDVASACRDRLTDVEEESAVFGAYFILSGVRGGPS